MEALSGEPLPNLPGDVLVAIAAFVPGTQDLLRFSCLVCRRFRNVLAVRGAQSWEPSNAVVAACGLPTGLNFEGLGWREAVAKEGLLLENRIGFALGSTQIDDSNESEDEYDDDENTTTDTEIFDVDDDDDSVVYEDLAVRNNLRDDPAVRNSLRRIAGIAAILKQFPKSRAQVDAHCGTLAPSGVADHFSAIRGAAAAESLSFAGDRVAVCAWGSRVADVAAASGRAVIRLGDSFHPYAPLALHGSGWAEIYLSHGDVQLPERPGFYHGVNPPILRAPVRRAFPRVRLEQRSVL